MFAPQPRTGAHSRMYASQTVSKKNLNKENAHALPSKTPSRQAFIAPVKLGAASTSYPSTSVRMGLGIKSMGRNNIQPSGMDREGDLDSCAPQRLFKDAKNTGISNSKSFSSLQVIHSPAMSRQHVSKQGPSSTPKQISLPAPAPTPLPSAGRKQRRQSRNSQSCTTPLKDNSNAAFRTPAVNSWDEGLSLGSINENDLLHQDETIADTDSRTEEDVEYMPPSAIPLPWEPAWCLKDPAAIFLALTAMPPLLWGQPIQDRFETSSSDTTTETLRLSLASTLEEPLLTDVEAALSDSRPSTSRTHSRDKPSSLNLPSRIKKKVVAEPICPSQHFEDVELSGLAPWEDGEVDFLLF